MASTMDNQAQAAALAGAAEAAAAKLHDVASRASEVRDREKAPGAAAPGPARDKVQQTASAVAASGRDLVALIRRFPLLSVLAGLGIGFKMAQALYRPAAKKAEEAKQG
jgi:hypothetical protein